MLNDNQSKFVYQPAKEQEETLGSIIRKAETASKIRRPRMHPVIVDNCYNYISVWNQMTIDYLHQNCKKNYDCTDKEFKIAVCRYIDGRN